MLDLSLVALSNPEIIISTIVIYFIRQTYRDNRDWMIFDLVGIFALSAFALFSGKEMVAELQDLRTYLPELILALSAMLVWYFIIDLIVLAWQRAHHM